MRTATRTVVAPILERLGYNLERAKTNIGLGRDRRTSLKATAADCRSIPMTNTLHRFGRPTSFHDDYMVFAIASKGKNDEGALEKLREFLRMARPVWTGESWRRTKRRSIAPVQEHASDIALGSRHDAGFRGCH